MPGVAPASVHRLGQDLEAPHPDHGAFQGKGQRPAVPTPTRRPVKSPGPSRRPPRRGRRETQPGARHTSLDGGSDRLGVMAAPVTRHRAEHAGLVGQATPASSVAVSTARTITASRVQGASEVDAIRVRRGPARLVDGDRDDQSFVFEAAREGRTKMAPSAEHRPGHVPPLDDGHRVVLHQLADGEVDDLPRLSRR